jgi:hypothetical protein
MKAALFASILGFAALAVGAASHADAVRADIHAVQSGGDVNDPNANPGGGSGNDTTRPDSKDKNKNNDPYGTKPGPTGPTGETPHDTMPK